MQKFTVFTVIFAVTLLLVLGDLIVHDYLKSSALDAGVIPTNQETPYLVDGEDSLDPMTNDIEEDFLIEDPETGEAAPLGEVPLLIDEFDNSAEDGLLVEEVLVETDSKVKVDQASLATDTFTQAGFAEPVLKDAIFSGLVFNIVPFTDQVQANIYQWNLFDGEGFIGSIYELRYPTETGSFQGYLSLRDRTASMVDQGQINEVNLYGDASFYFNHFVKTKTVHIVIRSGRSVFAFEYAFAHHETMKKLFDLL